MKKILFVLMMVAAAVAAKAEIGEWALGGQFVYACKSEMPGVGIHFKSNYSHAWRSTLSANYYFKKHGVTRYDLNVEQNYLFEVGEKVRLYPLVGATFAYWHMDDIDIDVAGTHFGVDGDDQARFGANVGAGIDYLIGDHLVLNGEVKYQFMKDARQVLLGVGVAYRF